MFMNTHHEEM